MSLDLAKVIKVHPEAGAVDLVSLTTGRRVPMVKVMSSAATTNSGLFDLAEPTEVAEDGVTATKDRDMLAVTGMLGGLPIVIGFLPPEVCQILFDRKNFKVDRHASDFYSTTDDAGNFVLRHPSGTHITIGESPEPEDLTGLDFDQKWAVKRNTDKQVNLRLEVKAGGETKAKLNLAPNGDVDLVATGNLTADVTGDVAATIGGNANVTVAGDAEIAVSGNITSSAALWKHTGPMEVRGDVDVIGGDVTADGISLKTHKHTGVTVGASLSGTPV